MIRRADNISHDPEETGLKNVNLNNEGRSDVVTKSAENIFEYCKQDGWITSCEEQISNLLDGLSDTSKQSRRSASSHTSQSSNSLQSARLKEKTKVA